MTVALIPACRNGFLWQAGINAIVMSLPALVHTMILLILWLGLMGHMHALQC